MSTHNMFSQRNKENNNTFGLEKASYQELCLCVFFVSNGNPCWFYIMSYAADVHF